MGSAWGEALYEVSKGPALAGPQSPGARADQHTRSHFLSAHHMVPQIVPVLSHGCYLCLRLMFTSLGKKAKEIQGKMLCRGHFLIWKNLQEHVQDWLEITLLWLFFIVLRYMTVKLAGESGDSKLQTPAALQARSFGSLGKQKEKTSSEEDYIFHMLTLLEMDLVKFVSRL